LLGNKSVQELCKLGALLRLVNAKHD
jgi:hypothetical protein